MDPRAVLELMIRCLLDEDPDGARDAYNVYRKWRITGGFEPIMKDGSQGDFTAALAVRRLKKAEADRLKIELKAW